MSTRSLSHPHSMTFQHDLLLGPCTYPGHINTAPTCTISLKLVLVFVFASNLLLLSLPSPLRKILIDKFFVIKNLHCPGLSIWWSRSCLSHFFSIAYWEDVSLFVSIARPRSRKKGVRLHWASVLNSCNLDLMSLRYIVSPVTVQGYALDYKALSLQHPINHFQSPFLFLFVSLVWNHFPHRLIIVYAQSTVTLLQSGCCSPKLPSSLPYQSVWAPGFAWIAFIMLG